MKAVIWRLLPEGPPGVTFTDLLNEIYVSGSDIKGSTLHANFCLLRELNGLRESGTRPNRYWRGPFDPGPKPNITGRPPWSFPDARLLAEAHAARDEIRRALKR
jgi:hypothetical protein